MRKKFILLTSICLLALTISVSAQKNDPDNFVGEWTLDVKGSELGERSQIESMTMKVAKSFVDGKNWLSVTKTTKRAKAEGRRGLRGRFGRGRGGEINGKNVQTVNYDLSGKETKSDVSRGRAAGKASSNVKMLEDGSMIIKQKTKFSTPRGAMEIKNTETWVLSADGKTLTISNERETPRGNQSSKMVFSRIKSDLKGFRLADSADESTPTRIGGGVVNGKANRLPRPEYPAAAGMAKVKGAVNVEIIISKSGKVISARAISGHPLLRKAAVDAARKAVFKPTTLEGQPVEVKGVVVYNFQ